MPSESAWAHWCTAGCSNPKAVLLLQCRQAAPAHSPRRVDDSTTTEQHLAAPHSALCAGGGRESLRAELAQRFVQVAGWAGGRQDGLPHHDFCG
jgi:hypothetical protein